MAQKEATIILKLKDMASGAMKAFGDRFVITAGDIINMVKEISGAIIDFGKEAIDAYRQNELAVNQLTQAMVNQGVYTTSLKNEYLAMASALQKVTVFDDEAITGAIGVLQAYTGQTAVTEDLVLATLNLATAKQMDVRQSAELIGKSIEGSNALKRYGIEVEVATDSGTRLSNVIRAINGDFNDYAVIAAKGIGATEQAKNAWGDFMEEVGRLIAPFVIQMARAGIEVANFFSAFTQSKDTSSIAGLGREIDDLRNKIKEMEAGGSWFDRLFVGDSTARDRMLGDMRKTLIDLENLRLQKLADMNDQEDALEAAARQKKRQRAAEEAEKDRMQKESEYITEYEMQINQIGMSEAQITDMELQANETRLKNAQGAKERKAAMEQRYNLLAIKEEQKMAEEKKRIDAELLAHRDKFLGHMASLQQSNNKTLAAIGKAAAIAQITINTAEAASSGNKWGFAMGGPALGATFAALAWAAGAAQIAKVNGVQLAQGGIVMPRPGGTQATIGEAGQAEAVIPLDRAGEFGLGGAMVINFNGPIMGDSEQARTFALAVDRELLKLRQNNESVSFDSGII